MRNVVRGTRFAVVAAAVALLLAACSAGDVVGGGDDDAEVALTFLTDNSEASLSYAEGLAAAYTAEHPNVSIDVETRPGGSDGDNIVKTRLSTGDMNDIFLYNTGSLFQALDPQENLAPIDDETLEDVDAAFQETVTAGGDVYGVPVGTATGGGVLYNKAIYADLGLEVPTTWDEFMANNAVIAEAGIVPVIQTFADTWTSQLFVLGDFHNVASVNPDWAEQYTANQVKYVDEPAVEGFRHQQEVFEAGYLNEDYASATLTDGLDMLATGQGAHYPMLTFALGEIYNAHPEATNDIGVFGIPGDNADDAGLTVWTGGGIYIPSTTTGDKLEAAQAFLAFIASPEGCVAQTEAYAPAGPYFIMGCELPDEVPPAVTDMVTYFDSEATTPALEFVSPVKGPALEQITVEVGSGIRSAEDGAALYDEDVKKQAQQLGLEGWD